MIEQDLGSSAISLLSTFSIIGLAEMGDKSQLVCLTLAARYRSMPVLLGAILAFSFLNLLAVIFGATLANWLPAWTVALAVGILFLGFGIHALTHAEDEEAAVSDALKSGKSVFLSALILITLAEFGDKTQIAVAGLASTGHPVSVWLGATLALAVTSGLGVWAGKMLLQRFPLALMHRISAVLFLLMGVAVLARLLF